ncbi:MAG: NAD(P)/FAD-dependent oxidoreductase [Granulosicoccus sp.]
MSSKSLQAEQSRTVVVGAGIVGVSTALWLSRAGKQVTLIDRLAPGEGTSHGNGGVLASCAIVPVTSPGLVGKAPRLLMNAEFPLFLRWSYLPKLAPWLRRYLSFANDADTRRIAEHLKFVVGDSVEQHQDLAGNTNADKWLVPSDYQFAYRTRADYEADAYTWSLRRDNGFVPELVEGPAVQEKEPVLGPEIKCLAVVKNHGHIRSPGLYVKSLAEVFLEQGGQILQADVHDFELSDGKVSSVVTSEGSIRCDSVVLAAGVWSGVLGKKLGIKIPMESERGYHVIFKDPSSNLNSPTMVASGKFVATPMHDGMRCAGIVEFGGLEAGPSKKPIELLMRHVKNTFPDMTYSDTVEWLGHRPAPADSLPFIGQIRQTGIYTAFGHHHIGLTGGAKTGRLVADIVCGEEPSPELDAFRPDRFN